ncbi:hypothetical protein VNO80_29595 [Phaseolus coccineus]|uniref:WIYLD domain-containing protein n=1 Tax=Phaseolus coccineus TaxID=3886 RepID=A0AAN9QF13_PHACN
MAPTGRAEKAFSFMMTLGISMEEVKPVLINLLRVYEGNWELIEDDTYRTLVDAYFDFDKDKNLAWLLFFLHNLKVNAVAFFK